LKSIGVSERDFFLKLEKVLDLWVMKVGELKEEEWAVVE
jgi:hypothetical protein